MAADRMYPLVGVDAQVEESRFTLGLVMAVADVLEDHGFPAVGSGADLVRLRQALYGFCYGAEGAA